MGDQTPREQHNTRVCVCVSLTSCVDQIGVEPLFTLIEMIKRKITNYYYKRINIFKFSLRKDVEDMVFINVFFSIKACSINYRTGRILKVYGTLALS